MLRSLLICILVALNCVAMGAGYGLDSTKAAGTSMKCPAPYKCIEVKISQGLLLESIPLDQPILLYAKNSDGIESGYFTVAEVKSEKAGKPLEEGALRIDAEENMIYAVVNKFLKANRTYRFSFHTSVPAKTKQQIHKIIVTSFLSIKQNLVVNGSISGVQIDRLRASLLAKLPADAAKLITPNSFLDEYGSYSITSKDRVYMDNLYGANEQMEKINLLVNDLSAHLKTFLSSENIPVIKAKHGPRIASNLQSISTDAKRQDILSGRASFTSPEALQPTLSLFTMRDFNIDAYLENLSTNIEWLENWKTDPLIDQEGMDELIKGMKDIILILETHFYSNEIFIDGEKKALESTLVKSVMTSFDGSSFGDFQQSAKWYVGADIGVLGTNLNANSDGWYVLPYAGLNLSPVPINKEASIRALFREYKCGAIWRLLAFNAGITLTKISSDKYQGIYDFENQRALITGVGLRPWRGVKLGYGLLFINQKTGNSLNPSTRAISGKQYFSVSLDWDLRKLIPDIKSIFSN